MWLIPCVQLSTVPICVVSAAPDGVVTYARRYVNHSDLPQWDKSQKLLTKLHITSKGTIEDDGAGLLQVDFANKYVYRAVYCLIGSQLCWQDVFDSLVLFSFH